MTSLTYVARIRLVKSTHLDHPLPIILIQTKATLTLLSKLTMKTPLTEALLSLWDKLEALFKRKVDLLTEDSIRNPYLKSNINRTKKLVYDGEGECFTNNKFAKPIDSFL